MKKKDKAALMKIIIGGLVLVGLYFGWQAMSGDSSPFSMASKSPYINFQRLKGGKPFHGEKLKQTAKVSGINENYTCTWTKVATWRGIVKTNKKAVDVKEVYYRIAKPLKRVRWGSKGPYQLENVLLKNGDGKIISSNYSIVTYGTNQKYLKFDIENHIIEANTKEEWQVWLDAKVSAKVKDIGPTSGSNVDIRTLRLDLASKFAGFTVITKGVGGVPTKISRIGDTPANGKNKKFICQGSSTPSDGPSDGPGDLGPTGCKVPEGPYAVPAKIDVKIHEPLGSVLREGRDVQIAVVSLGHYFDQNIPQSNQILKDGIKVGKIELDIRTKNASLTPDSIKVSIGYGSSLALRSHYKPTIHPAGSLRSATTTSEWEGIISFKTPLEIATTTMLRISANVASVGSGEASIVTSLKRDEENLRTNSNRDRLERSEYNSFSWWSCNNNKKKEWKNAFYLNKEPVRTLPSKAVSVSK